MNEPKNIKADKARTEGRDLRSASIRLAGQEDLIPLTELAERTFREAFWEANDPADMESYLREAFSREQIASELLDGANTFLLAFVPGEAWPVGYVKLRAGQPDPAVRGAHPVELHRIYVDQSAVGHGLGTTLMRESLRWAQERGFQTLWLGVWEHNPGAIRFYQRWGFQTVGAHDFLLGSDEQSDLIMELSLKPPADAS